MRRRYLSAVAFSLLPAGAFAGGGIATPRVGGLGPHSPTEGDAAAIYWNPAAITLINEEFRLVLDVTYTSARGTVQRFVGPDGTPPDETTQGGEIVPINVDIPIPYLGAVYKINPKLAAGIAFMAPVGRAGDFLGDCRNLSPAEVRACELSSPVRYFTTRSTLQSLYLSPTAAFAITPNLSVGASVNVVYSMFASDAASDASGGTEDPNNQAFVHIGAVIEDGKDELGRSTDEDGDGTALIGVKPLTGINYGASVGLYYSPNDWFSAGASYSSRVNVVTEGAAVSEVIAAGQSLGPQDEGTARVSYTLPDTLNLGVKLRLSSQLDVDVWAQYMNQKVHDKIDIDLENFEINDTPNSSPINQPPDPEEGLPGTALARNFQNNTAVNFGLNYWTFNRKARVGGAIMYEGSAIPTEAQTSAAFDGDKIDLMSYLEYHPSKKVTVTLGFSFIRGLAPTDNTDNSIFKGSFSSETDCQGGPASDEAAATGLCYAVGNGIYQVGVGRVGLTTEIAF